MYQDISKHGVGAFLTDEPLESALRQCFVVT
jgi:hypothetical protein